jgi:nucleotide-sensitive chloride channel 1A
MQMHVRFLSILHKHTFSILSHFKVEPIFEALSLCASLHPDQMDEDEEDNAFIDSGNFETFDGDANEELSEVGRVRSDFVNENRYAPY